MHYTKTKKPRRNDPWDMVTDVTWIRDFAGGFGFVAQLDDDHYLWRLNTKEVAALARGIAPSLTLAKAAVLQSAKKRKLTTTEKTK